MLDIEQKAKIKNQEFIEAIERELDGVDYFSVGVNPDCEGCTEYFEGSFSWQHCDSCGSRLGGDRFPAHGFIGGDLIHFEVCSDCVQYHSNGELPW